MGFQIFLLVQWLVSGLCSLAMLYAITAAVVTTLVAKGTARERCIRSHDSHAMAIVGISVLKPLCGDEPRLYENLVTFCEQTHPAFQLIFGVSSSDDPAIAAVRRLQHSFAELDISLVVDDRLHGANRKVSNLINMAPRIRHPWVVIADSDIAVDPHYLASVTAPLHDATVGVVTCLYRGVGVRGIWSRIGALFINEWFAPSVSIAHAGGSTRFGFGATLALRASTLDRIGGFARLKDCLADDYWLAEHARAIGLETVLSSEVVVETDVTEANLRALWARETRWLRTIRSLNPLGFGFLFITFTSPWLLMSGALSYAFYADDVILAEIEMAWIGSGMTASGCVARVALHARSARDAGGFWRDLALLPLRDSLLLCQWLAACFGKNVAWRDASLVVDDARSCVSVPNPSYRSSCGSSRSL